MLRLLLENLQSRLFFFSLLSYAGLEEGSEAEHAGADAGGRGPEIHSAAVSVRASEGGEVRPDSSRAAS